MIKKLQILFRASLLFCFVIVTLPCQGSQADNEYFILEVGEKMGTDEDSKEKSHYRIVDVRLGDHELVQNLKKFFPNHTLKIKFIETSLSKFSDTVITIEQMSNDNNATQNLKKIRNEAVSIGKQDIKFFLSTDTIDAESYSLSVIKALRENKEERWVYGVGSNGELEIRKIKDEFFTANRRLPAQTDTTQQTQNKNEGKNNSSNQSLINVDTSDTKNPITESNSLNGNNNTKPPFYKEHGTLLIFSLIVIIGVSYWVLRESASKSVHNKEGKK